MTEPSKTCTRGHAVADDAVLCTVCWERVGHTEPAGSESAAAGPASVDSHHLKRAALALGVVVLAGVAVAVTIALTHRASESHASPAATPSASAPAPADARQPVSVNVPQAATVSDALPAAGCSMRIGPVDAMEDTPCTVAADVVTFATCRLADTTSVDLLRRVTEPEGAWTSWPVSSEFRSSPSCPDGKTEAVVTFSAKPDDTDGYTWRLVGRDGQGDRLWRTLVLVDLPGTSD